jgi:alkyl hydroperoxide reductase subunit AhpF
MAIAAPRVRADIVDLTEFRDLVARYAVRGVPKTIINDRLYFDGVLPEPDVLAAVLRAAAHPDGEAQA